MSGVVAHVYPSFTQALATKTQNAGASGDVIKVSLIASTSPVYTWGSTPEGQTTYTNWLTGDGTHGAMTEVTGGSYAALSLTAASQAIADSGLFTTLTYSGSISWSSVTFTTTYAVFYFSVTGQLICYWDLGGSQSVSGATFTLALASANGVSNSIVQWTSS
jgi:hypothetical protein